LLIVCCRVGDAAWGFDARDVVSVVPAVVRRPVPQAPPVVAGLVRWRGGLLPVLDLGVLLGGTPCRERLDTRILVLRRDAGLVGLRAERVTDTAEIPAESFLPSPIASPDAAWLGPVAMHEGELLQLVRPGALLTPDLAALLETAARAVEATP
jgi:chemotaxis-related protein WspB